MDPDALLLILAGGVVGFIASILGLTLQRWWAMQDRRAAIDREALDLAMLQLMAWQAVALGILSGKPDTAAEKRLSELDVHWEADPRLIPERQAAAELLRSCKAVILAPRYSAEREDALAEHARIIELGDRVLGPARDRRRKLA